ncbi:MAG TPA: 1-acyl-sn-glycerol-3-phosphate acyltransferase [Bdellovibrionota bacterium]|nr:1-acyl-sn-glycerol-3-phosphate acyltransferase [Bdellovibrionota bacterium]
MFLNLVPESFLRVLFRSLEAGEPFAESIDKIRKEYPERPIALALTRLGFVEFLALQTFLKRRFGSEFQLTNATGLHSIWIESLGRNLRRVAAFLRLAPRPKTRILFCLEALRRGETVALELKRRRTGRDFEESTSERELGFLSYRLPNLIVVPVTFVWLRKVETTPDPHGLSPGVAQRLWIGLKKPLLSPWTFIWGDPYEPRGLRKLFLMLRGYTKSTIRLGAPLEASTLSPMDLRNRLFDADEEERRIILGPTHTSHSMVSEHVLRNPRFVEFTKRLAAEEGVSQNKILERANKYYSQTAAKFSFFFLELGYNIVMRMLRLLFDGFHYEKDEIEYLRNTSRKGPLVLIPSHKSYMDFLLLSTILYQEDLLPPHVAAGSNLNIGPIGLLFRRGGAFFIKRSFRGNHLYSEVLRRYIAVLLNQRYNLEFFIEGARSRNGKLAPPKFGILKMIVDSYLLGDIQRDVQIIPVSITYDKVTEDKAHKRELEGGEKIPESMANAVKSSGVLFKKHGKVMLRFSPAISLDYFLKECGTTMEDPNSVRKGVQKLAFEVCHRINEKIPVTALGLVCSIFLAKPGNALSKSELEQWLMLVQQDLFKLGTLLNPDLQEGYLKQCRRALARLVDEKVVDKYRLQDEGVGLRVPGKQRVAALYYKNSVVHAFLIPALKGIVGNDKEAALELRSYLVFEFFFAEKDEYLDQLADCPDGLMTELYANLIDDVLENTQIGLEYLLRTRNKKDSDKDWQKKFMKYGVERILDSSITRFESINTQSFRSFIEMAKNRGWLVRDPDDEGQLLVGDRTLLKNHLAKIEGYREKIPTWKKLKDKYLVDPSDLLDFEAESLPSEPEI